MKKILVMLALTLSFLSAMNLQTATKDELMCIKGIGAKKAEAIMKYRGSHKLKSADDLLGVKGLGKVLVKNFQKNIKSSACGGKKSTKTKKTKSSSKSTGKKVTSTKKKTSKKSDKKDSKKDKSKKKTSSDKKTSKDKK